MEFKIFSITAENIMLRRKCVSNGIIKSRDRKVLLGQVVNFPLPRKDGLRCIMYFVHADVCQTEL